MARRRVRKKNNGRVVIIVIAIIIIYLVAYKEQEIRVFVADLFDSLGINIFSVPNYSLDDIPVYEGYSYVIINDNEPDFEDEDFTVISVEKYSNLDYLGRCGVAYANIGIDLMPTVERESIGSIKPSGWQTIKYDIVDGKYLYNRCHLIGYQLTGENTNEKNLITCTRSMNTVGMLDFENQVANYIKETNNHVLYRVTPIFEGTNLVATGVQMEACSVEDRCNSIKFNVFVYNVQEGIEIDYSNGDSKLLS